jgi:hypothetical protein
VTRGSLVIGVLALLGVLGAASVAHAQAPTDQLRAASEALANGQYDRAAELSGALVHAAQRVDEIDRAEAYRVYGLAQFFLGNTDGAEAALLQYLRIEPDAHLDPGRFPPEVIVFFEDVRSRHSAELRGLRERPTTVREWSKNLFPPWGQVANGHTTKGIVLGTAEVLLLGTNLATFFVLDGWCDRNGTGVCVSGDEDRRSTARTLRMINLASAAALAATYVYGVVDGFHHHRRLRQRDTARYMSVGVTPTDGGGMLLFSRSF